MERNMVTWIPMIQKKYLEKFWSKESIPEESLWKNGVNP